MVEAGGILYGGTTRVFGYNPLVVSSASLYRSTDGGTTWTLIDDFMITPGSQAQINALAARGTRMAMLVAGGTGTFSGYVVRFSQDSGATWSTIYTALDGTYNHHGTDIKFYDNDTLIITGSRSSTTTSYEDWVIKRCVISSQTCADVEVVTSTSNINNQSQRVAVDGAGVIYVAGQQATTTTSYLKRSTDGGFTYTTLRTRVGGGDIGALDVNSDSSIILWGGSWVSTPWTEYTFDSGTNWSNNTTGAAALWNYASAKILPNRDLLYSGYCFSSCGAGMRWVANKRSFATGTWTNITPAVVDAEGRKLLIRSSDGAVIAYSSAGIKISTDAGANYSNITSPSTTEPLGKAHSAFFSDSATKHYRMTTEMTDRSTIVPSIEVSTDSGQNWSVDNTESAGIYLFAFGKSPTTSSLFAGGTSIANWYIRKKSGGVGAWTTSYNAIPSGGTSGKANGFAVSSTTGVIYSVGQANIGSSYRWTVINSANDGATWNTFDTYNLIGTYTAEAIAATFSGSNLIVAGSAYDNSGNIHWIVRSWNGTSWTTLDDFIDPGRLTNIPQAILAVGSDIYVTGYVGNNTGGASEWITRKYTAGSWSTVDRYQYNSEPARANSIIALSTGEILVAGQSSVNGIIRATIRKQTGSSWNTIDRFSGNGVSAYKSIGECAPGIPCAAGYSSFNTPLQQTLFRLLSP
jgi:hypothetical protein